MTNKRIQTGVVGCGWAGCRAIEAANATSRLNVIAIAERDPTRREQAGDDNAVPHRYADYQELLGIPMLKPSTSRLLLMVGCNRYLIRSMRVSMSWSKNRTQSAPQKF